MALWDLFFYQSTNIPPRLGVWYFLLPTSLVVVGVLSVRFAHSKSYQTFWYWGQLIQLLIINSWYLAARLPFQRVFPSIIVGWPCGLFFWPPREASSNILPSWESLAPLWPWFILFLSLPFSSRFLDQQCLWSLGPLGQLPNLSGSILPGGRRGRLEDLSDDVWGQCHYCSSQPCNGRKLWLSASTTCARRPWPCSQLFHRDSPNDGDTDPHQYYRSVQ